ncbi:MAG: 4-hydroxy-tetrahydrodipicolinate reductase [Hyphomicrobiales bacterium]|jgi:4-hydroxy-tetrahydrodipicolinate reductase|nr:4-hydroxy-tetrahydrodipicolinate reductase [Hyphomicrobiales bacterium]
MSDMRLIVAGAGGRMGRTLIKAIGETPGLVLAGATEGEGSPFLGQDSGVLAGLPPNRVNVISEVRPGSLAADGIIDFTVPAATVRLAALAAETHLVHIIGTTGTSAEDDAKIAEAAKKTAIMKSGNMSLGVNLLAVMTKRVAQALGDDFDIEIVEMHHNKKIDAPSGTALLFGEAAAAGRKIDLKTQSERGRDGHTGARKAGTIGFASLRGGNVAGEHSVIFAGADERIELTHKATDRMIFARGALKAALWARGKPPGLYSMLDVLGLKD